MKNDKKGPKNDVFPYKKSKDCTRAHLGEPYTKLCCELWLITWERSHLQNSSELSLGGLLKMKKMRKNGKRWKKCWFTPGIEPRASLDHQIFSLTLYLLIYLHRHKLTSNISALVLRTVCAKSIKIVLSLVKPTSVQ